MYLEILNYVKFNFKWLSLLFYLILELVLGYNGRDLNGENITTTEEMKVTSYVYFKLIWCNFLPVIRFYCTLQEVQ